MEQVEQRAAQVWVPEECRGHESFAESFDEGSEVHLQCDGKPTCRGGPAVQGQQSEDGLQLSQGSNCTTTL